MTKKATPEETQEIQYIQPQTFIGILIVKGYKDVNKKGDEGYWVLTDPNNINKKFWSNKESFDKMYAPIQSCEHISTEDLENMIQTFIWKKVDERTILGIAVLKTGFRIYATASCLSNKDNLDKGKEIVKEKIFLKLKSFLGFIVQWGVDGIRDRMLYGNKLTYIDLTDLDDLEF